MKKLLPILISFFVGLNLPAQSLPGRTQNNSAVLTFTSGSGTHSLLQPQVTPITQTASAIAEAITPDIQALADSLGNDPTKIFNYVHDEIRYVHYYGSKKGAELTLLERSGNDFDQCALLSALLQASGYLPQYQFAVMNFPYDSTNHLDLHHWLGLTMLNTNVSNTQTYFLHFLAVRGFPQGTVFNPDTNTYSFQHMWVTLALSGTKYYLDPSFKDSEPVNGLNLSSAMVFNSNTLWTATGGTDTGSSVTGLSESSLRGTLQSWNSNLLAYISNNVPGASVAQVIGGQQIVSSSGLLLSTNLPYSLYTNSTYPLLNWTNQPTNFMGTFSISVGGTNKTWLTPLLQGARLSLTFTNTGFAQLWQEDLPVLQTTNTGTSSRASVILSTTHPYGGGWSTSQNSPSDGGPADGWDQSSTNTYQRTNASYAIIYAFDASPAWLQKRQQKLNAYLQQGFPSTSRQVTTETLNVMGLGWMVQTELTQELLSQEWGQLPEGQHGFGRMAQESGKGYYVDVYLQLDGTFPGTGYNSQALKNNYQVFDVGNYIGSGMEHGIIEQLQNSNLVAASTVKMLEIAVTNSQPVYLATSTNWGSVSTNLIHYGTNMTTLSTLIGDGFALLLPQNGSNNVAGVGTWAGNAYFESGWVNGSRVAGAEIGGGYNGGYVSVPSATADAFSSFIAVSAFLQPTLLNPQSATLSLGTQLGADPVNMVDGTFQITSTDLSIGQTEPRGLNLTRYYSSERINSNPAGMAPGWLHSYYCTANAISDPQGGLGTSTVAQMAPMIVATYSALNFYSTNYDAKNWTVTALMAKWAVDQLTGNAVSVTLGNKIVQFIKQPNGSYTPPANCTMTLTQTNGAFVLQERHGRAFKFNTNSVLTNIVDQYNQSMTLSYSSNNFVTNVTDWKGRSLKFTYSGGTLTSVADSAGRSVSYAYTNGEMTAYTDPEQKLTVYTYDTNNELIATHDALNRLVETNIYDGVGHVATQLTQGDPTKAWQIYASGYYTVSTDPAGDQQLYTYDQKSRPIAFQDGMGNITQMLYDGQDHVTTNISPLGEITRSLYDQNNNLVETIDPLGFSNVFVYDANNNLVTSTDGRGVSSHYGYNAQFSLIGSTNGNGDWKVYAYNSDGTLHTVQDSAGTTTYGYDSSYGQLNSITYPGSLGSESFINSALGDPISHTDARSFTTTFGYNNRRQLTSTVAPTNLTVAKGYDGNANLSTITNSRGYVTSENWSVTRHLLSTTYPPTSQGSPVVTRTYDNRDWLFEMQDGLGYPTYYTNDPAQRLVAMTDPLSRATHFSYDADGDQLTATDAASDQTTQGWNARGQVVKITDAASDVVGKAYDGMGNLIYLTNRNGKLWTLKYDGANRLTNTTSPKGYASLAVYNNRGLLQSMTDPLNNADTYGYDARGRMTTNTDGVGTRNYQYDGNNNLTKLTQGVASLSWVYDAYNRAVSFTNASGYVIQYRYDANGNVTNLIYPGNLTVVYSYDSNDRLTGVTDWSGRQTVYTYDLDGRLLTVTRPNNTVRALGYDNAGELTNIVEDTTTKYPICFYTLHYNAASRCDWEFKAPLPHSNPPPTRTMTYDDDNRLAKFNGTSVTVDSNGRLTYGPGTNNTFGTYAYDVRNELTSEGGIGYGYDPARNRAWLTNGTSVFTNVVNPQGSQLLMRAKGNTTNYYIYGVGLIYEIDVTGSTTTTAFYHYDSRGSTIALTDVNGNPTDLIEYSPYGTTTYRYGTNTTPFLFNGQFGVQTDPNGLLYMRARYYNPYVSRFLNPDPSGFNGGLNFYVFCNDNPVSAEDPFGLFSWGKIIGGSLQIGGGVLATFGLVVAEAPSGGTVSVAAPSIYLLITHGAVELGVGLQSTPTTSRQENFLNVYPSNIGQLAALPAYAFGPNAGQETETTAGFLSDIASLGTSTFGFLNSVADGVKLGLPAAQLASDTAGAFPSTVDMTQMLFGSQNGTPIGK